MSDKTKIEWTDATWNPVTGCTKVSAGCDHCYAETIANRFAGTKAYPNGFDVTLWPDRLDQPLRWQRPRRVFVNSMSDLFHDQVPDEFIYEVFATMALAPQHTFQILTKRPGRMRSLLSSSDFQLMVDVTMLNHGDVETEAWPLPNVWLGVSAEDQKWANIRIPQLLATPAAVRFLSCEPLLGPVDLASWVHTSECIASQEPPWCTCHLLTGPSVDWVIVGGESGPHARPMHPNWARSLRDQCVAAGVPFLFKQWGEWGLSYGNPRQCFVWADGDYVEVHAPQVSNPITGATEWRPNQTDIPHRSGWTHLGRVGKRAAGRELDGLTWDEYPAVAA